MWAVFIHPLSKLDREQVVSAVAQTYNTALTYDTSFSSGVFNFGGGDNSDAHDALTERGLRS